MSEIIHIPGAQPLLFATAVFAVIGAVLLLRRRRIDAWWTFAIYGLVVSIVPASLTNEYFHMLRLAAVPVFLIVLTIPALNWIVAKTTRASRIGFAAILVVTLAQGLIFQYQYRAGARTPRRLHLFDADYAAKILPTALAAASGPIYIADAPAVPGYIQAYWYGTLQRIPLERFVILGPEKPAPEGAVVITTEMIGPRWRIVTASEPYTVCTTWGAPRVPAPLPDNGFRAEINVIGPPSRIRRGEPATIKVELKNTSNVVWLARERTLSPFQLSVANHWLDPEGRIIVHDDGRGALPRDLRPGESVEVQLTINAPPRAGDYQLEVDMLQESVSWFGLRGSQTQRISVTVED